MSVIDSINRAVIGASIRARTRFDALAPQDDPEEGSTTVEYSIGALATAGLAGLLVAVLRSDAVKSLIEGLIRSAFSM